MKTTRDLVRKARELFDVADVPRHTNRHNRRQWVRSVQRLGSKWVYWETMKLERRA